MIKGGRIILPKIFFFYIFIRLGYLAFGLFNNLKITFEMLSISRDILYIFFASCLSANYKLLNKRLLLFAISFLIVIDFSQAFNFHLMKNFAMKAYYNEISIPLIDGPNVRYVWYVDHYSFSVVMMYLISCLGFIYSNNVVLISYISFGLITSTRLYAVFIVLLFLRNLKIVLPILLSLGAICFIFGFEKNYLSSISNLINDIDMRIYNWSSWLSYIINNHLFLGIGSYGIMHKREFMDLEVSAIDNLFVNNLVHYGLYGIFVILVYIRFFGILLEKRKKLIYCQYFLGIYILLSSLFNDLISNPLHRVILYTLIFVCMKIDKKSNSASRSLVT